MISNSLRHLKATMGIHRTLFFVTAVTQITIAIGFHQGHISDSIDKAILFGFINMIPSLGRVFWENVF